MESKEGGGGGDEDGGQVELLLPHLQVSIVMADRGILVNMVMMQNW